MPYLYHIHTPEMDLSNGYIGIANDPEVRWKQHEHCAHNLNHRYVVYQQMRNHKGDYIKTVIDEGTREYVSQREFELRPKPMMGWNMATGGGNPIIIWRQPDTWLSNELWNSDYGEVIITKDFNVTDLAMEFYNKPNNSTERVEINRVLNGKRYEYKGWQLRDAQLAMSVKTWLAEPWTHVYLTDETETISLYKNGAPNFCKYVGKTAPQMKLAQIAKGVQIAAGWSLATEEEYNLNPGRVFGTPEKEEK